MQLFESLAGHMGIDLSSRYVCMAEQHLHDSQIGAVIDQMRGKGMAQGMW